MNKKRFALIANILVGLSVVYCMAVIFAEGVGGNMDGSFSSLCYFTVQSNILIGVVSLVSLYYLIKDIKVPAFFRYLKFASVAAITTTMLVACCFLSVLYSLKGILGGINFFMHLSTPLVSLISFLFFENEKPFDKKAILIGMLPTILYGIVYYFQVVVYQTWPDFYGFNQGGKWYITIVVMTLFESVLCSIIRLIINRKNKDH